MTGKERMTAHEVLVAAKGYLLNHGWKQGGYGRDGGPRCMVGALASAVGLSNPSTTNWRPEPMKRAQKAIEDEVGYWTSWFNDDEAQSLDDVIDAFDRAILATAPKVAPVPNDASPLPVWQAA